MKWKKLGRIFNPETWKDGIERPWMNTHSQCTSTLVLDEVVRVYFSCRPPADSEGQYVSYTTFLDLDRNDLSKIKRVSDKPVMDLGELGTFDEFAVYPTCVFRNNNDIFLYYAGWTRCKSTPYTVSIGLGISKDNGETFERYGKGPILTNSPLEPFELSGPKVRKINDKFFMYYLAGERWTFSNGRAESTYKIKLAISENGIDFKKLNKSIIENRLEHECQAGPDVFYLDGSYHMYFAYRHNFDYRNNERGYRIGYAHSQNAVDWVRDDSQAGIDLSSDGWDSQMHHYPHVFNVDDKWYMLYNGNDFGRYGFGLAILNN